MTRSAWLAIALVLVCWTSSASAETGPRQVVEAANEQIHKLVTQDAREGTPEAAERDRQLKTVVNDLLDLDFMAQDALGRTWSERTPAERQEYVSLMRQLVERSYLRQARSRVQYTVSFGAVDVDQAHGRAEVETTLDVTTRGRREEIEVVYTMALRDGRWRVVDVETDGASTVRNYRAQFRRIIQQDGFGELLSRMRSRLEAGESDL